MRPPSDSHAAGLYFGHTSRSQGVDRNHNERAEIIQNGARRVRRVPYQAVEGTNRNTLVSCTRLVKCGRVEAVRFRFRRKVEQRDRGGRSQRTPLLPEAYIGCTSFRHQRPCAIRPLNWCALRHSLRRA